MTYRNYRAWRTLVKRHPDDPDEAVLRWGRGVALGTFPVSDTFTYAFALENGADDAASEQEPWRHFCRVAAGFGPSAQSVAARVSAQTPTIYTPVYQVDAPRWVAGPVVLIGDAAHAIVPMLAQGAALAIEDAVLLADFVARAATPAAGAVSYAAERRPRIEEASAICGFASLASGIEGPTSPDALRDHPGNPRHFGGGLEKGQQRLWAGIDGWQPDAPEHTAPG